MRWLSSLLLFVAIPVAAQTPSQPEQVIDLSGPQSAFRDCGFVSRFPGSQMAPNCLQQSTNLLTDNLGIISRRNGYAQYNLTPCTGSKPIRGMWSFYSTNGTQYLVAHSSGSMYYSAGDGTCNTIPGLNGGLSLTATMECVQSLGYLWCTDGTDPVFQTDVVSTAVVSGAPLGTHIGTFRNRILISGVSGSFTRVYGSGELNGTDWSLPAIQYSTSPFVIDVSGINDGLAVTCLMGEFQNQFLIGRKNDLSGLAGYDNRDFTLRKISSQIGCIEPKSAQEVNNVFYWLSNRGIEGMTGTQIQRVSYPIDPTINLIIKATGNTRNQVITSQADWQAGNLTPAGAGAPISATISPGNIVVSTFGATDNTSANFGSGTLGALLTTGTYANAVVYSSASYPIINGDFSLGNLNGWTCGQFASNFQIQNACSFSSSGGNNAQISVQSISGASARSAYAQIDILDGSFSVYSTQYQFNTTPPAQLNIDLAGLGVSTRTLSIKYTVAVNDSDNNNGYTTIQSTTFTAISSMTIATTGSFAGKQMIWNIRSNSTNRYFSQYASSAATALFVSQIFDTGFSTPIGGPFTATVSSGSGTTEIFAIRSSTSPNNDLWTAFSAINLNDRITQTKRYWQYESSFTTSVGTMTPVMYGVGLVGATTGFYISNCIQVSTPTSWGSYNVNGVTNNGTLNFYVSTGATCGIATAVNANWTAQPQNSQIVVTTGTNYVATKVLFGIDAATQTPTVNDITFNWNQGLSRPPVSSLRWDDRYVLFYTTSTSGGAANDHAVILDQNAHWQLWDDIPAASAALYLNQPYIGDSAATGTIYQLDSGQTDNGKSFTMTFQTADLDGGDPNMLKTFSRVYLMMSAPSSNNSSVSINCNYSIDGSTLTYALGPATLSESPEQTGYFVAKFPVPAGQPATGHWFNFQCSYTGAVGPLSIHRARVVYTPLTWD